jgi:hypothetical protein
MSDQIAAEVCQVNIGPNDDFVKRFQEIEAFFTASPKKWVFRGQRNKKRGLVSSLERIELPKWKVTKADWLAEITKTKDVKDALSEYQQERFDEKWQHQIKEKEKAMIERFKARLRIDVGSDQRQIPYLAIMQHYGIPTRLLDFTEEIAVALYFAFEKPRKEGEDENNDRVIWAVQIDPIEIHSKQYKAFFQKADTCNNKEAWNYAADELFKSEVKIIPSTLKRRVVPVWMAPNNPRMMAQKGLFLMAQHLGNGMFDFLNTLPPSATQFKTPEYSIEEFLSLPKNKEKKIAVIKIIFDDGLRRVAKRFLNKKNIIKKTVYPDMANVRNEICAEFGY